MTGESGRAYGEESYGGPGYGYGHSQEGGIATAAPDPTLPEPHLRATGLPGAGPDHLGTVDSPHGDVITVPPPDRDPSESDPARPVFVDASGRRQRRVRSAARLLVIPAACYVALLISTVLGGPTISAPFVPLPDTPHTPHATAPGTPAGTGHAAGSAGSGTAYDGSRPGASRTASGPTGRPTASTADAATSEPTTTPTGTTSPAGTASPTATTATSTATPTAGATAAHSGKGRAVGSSHKPVK
ncbi:hypothetical protein [Streptomyces sp. NPDC101234]|uniref:hypothetical protein n=1 Tax=Streptomyces sp. NPDC101234 TaxID=3366138 RepID=UPI0038155487